MKKLIYSVLCVILLFSTSTLYAQDSKIDDTQKNTIAYKLRGDSDLYFALRILELKENGIVLQKNQIESNQHLPVSSLEYIKINAEESFSFKAVLQDAGVGFLVGAGVGFVFGNLLKHDKNETGFLANAFAFDENETPIKVTGFLGVTGALIGGMYGALRSHAIIKIPINGKQSKYVRQKEKLKKYSLQY